MKLSKYPAKVRERMLQHRERLISSSTPTKSVKKKFEPIKYENNNDTNLKDKKDRIRFGTTQTSLR